MRKSILLVLGLSLGFSSMASADKIGLYADPAGTSCDLPATFATPVNWYLVAKLAPGEDLTGLEARITGLPADFLVLGETAAPGILTIGSVFSAGGTSAGLSCTSASPLLLLTIQVLPLGTEVGALQIVAHDPSILSCGGDPVTVDCGVSYYCAEGGYAYFNQTGCQDVWFSDGFESGDMFRWSVTVPAT